MLGRRQAHRPPGFQVARCWNVKGLLRELPAACAAKGTSLGPATLAKSVRRAALRAHAQQVELGPCGGACALGAGAWCWLAAGLVAGVG